MSLVAYDYSDDSEGEENESQNSEVRVNEDSTSKIYDEENLIDDLEKNNIGSGTIKFPDLPETKSFEIEDENEIEEECRPKKKEIELRPQKPMKNNGPVRISIPSLSSFKDVDEEIEKSSKVIKTTASTKKSGLFAILPPPKGAIMESKKQLIPQSITKKSTELSKTTNALIPRQIKTSKPPEKKKTIPITNDGSESEDEEPQVGKNTDFFSFSASTSTSDIDPKASEEAQKLVSEYLSKQKKMEISEEQTPPQNADKNTLSSLGKKEILMKNNVEVGPKLPVPEQEYNIDERGNVAFDEKAMEYLCGKSGVKRKLKELESVEIVEINGDDIKPDERDWLVKALTEQPVTRPVSLGSGPGGASKRKHQITYLAHQAKAMEMELQNQWAQNRLTKNQTRAKYGF